MKKKRNEDERADTHSKKWILKQQDNPPWSHLISLRIVSQLGERIQEGEAQRETKRWDYPIS